MITANDLEPGYYLAELPEPLDNPRPDRRYRDLWTAATTFPADRRYTLIVRRQSDLTAHLEDTGVKVFGVELSRLGQYGHHHYHALLFVHDNGERRLDDSREEGTLAHLLEHLSLVEPTLHERVKLLERYEYVGARDIVHALIEAGVLDDKTLSLCVALTKERHERELAEEELERERKA